jgi:hypothetical protein
VVTSSRVAHRGEAGGNRPLRVLCHAEDAQARGVAVLHGRVGESPIGEVDVAIDQARRDRRVRDVDPLRIRRRIDARSDSADAVALDEHRARTQRFSTTTVNQRVGRDQDRAHFAQGEREV